MENQIQLPIAATLDEFNEIIESFTDENFNKIPFEGSWTAGQVAEHIRLASGTIPKLLQGNTETSSRNPDEKVSQIKGIFMNTETKMKAPESIVPALKPYDRKRFVEFFDRLKTDMVQAENDLDLSLICLDFEVPGFGPMTRLEWIAFVNFHTKRHGLQMKNIAEKLQ